MPIPGLDHNRCLQRNRVAARRDGVNAVPLRFLRGTPNMEAGFNSSGNLVEVSVLRGNASANLFLESPHNRGGVGKLPKSDEEALATINAARGDGATPLTAEDVYIHYLEAANDNYIGDRYMFLDDTTLKNIATDAQAGFAFMNSHRTGGLSHQSELPYGKTFAGRFENVTGGNDDSPSARTVVGFYMLSRMTNADGSFGPVYPNGANGPSTADFHAMIDGGTLFDCSVGLWGGTAVCDICGEDLNAIDDEWDYLCPHVPGTTYKMTALDMAAQEARGVPGGMATYSLVDAHCGEVSGVYDGAVPGAGFQKAMAFSGRDGTSALPAETLSQIRASYASLLRPNAIGDSLTLPFSGRALGDMDADELGDLLSRLLPQFAANDAETDDRAAPGTAASAALRGKGNAMSTATQPRPRKSLTANATQLGMALLAALGMGGNHDADAIEGEGRGITIDLNTNEVTHHSPSSTESVNLAETPEMKAMKAQLDSMNEQLARANERADKNERESFLKDDLAKIKDLRNAFKVTPAVADELEALAKTETGHVTLSAVLPALAKGTPIASLAGEQATVDATAAAAESADAISEQLTKLTKTYMAEHSGCSYSDAFSAVCRENKNLALKYREAQSAQESK